MLVTGLLLVGLTAAPVKLAAMGLKPVKVDATEAMFFNDYLAQQLRSPGELEVATQSELGAILGLERQKQLLGCTDAASSNCLAELSGALGVDAIIAGNVAKLGGSYTLTLSIVRVTDGRTLASVSDRLKTADDVLDWIKKKAPELRAAALTLRAKNDTKADAAATPSAVKPAAGVSVSPHRFMPFVLIGVGAAAVITGIVLQAVARATASNIASRADGVTFSNVDQLISTGKTEEGASIALLCAGAAAAVGGVAWLVLRPNDTMHASFSVTPGGAFATFGGSWP